MQRHQKALSGGSAVIRSVNPGPLPTPKERPSLKQLVSQGTKVLSEAVQRSATNANSNDPDIRREALTSEEMAEVKRVWRGLKAAYDASAAEQRTALTRIQTLLRRWTEETAYFAANAKAQAYRRVLHIALDH